LLFNIEVGHYTLFEFFLDKKFENC
jgi:hypothetical protein